MRLAATTSGDLCLEFASAIYFSFAPSFFFSLFRTTHAQNSRGESAGQKGKALCREDPEKIWVAVFLCNEFKSNRRCHFRLLLRRCATLPSLPARRFFLVCRCFSSFLLFFCVIRERNVSVATVISTRLVQLVCLTLCVWFCQLLHETAG